MLGFMTMTHSEEEVNELWCGVLRTDNMFEGRDAHSLGAGASR